MASATVDQSTLNALHATVTSIDAPRSVGRRRNTMTREHTAAQPW
jgi:hypothetical protein